MPRIPAGAEVRATDTGRRGQVVRVPQGQRMRGATAVRWLGAATWCLVPTRQLTYYARRFQACQPL